MNLLYLTILLPLIGFLLLAFSRGRWSENFSAVIGVGSVMLAALTTVYIGIDYLPKLYDGQITSFNQPLWTWIHQGNFDIQATLH